MERTAQQSIVKGEVRDIHRIGLFVAVDSGRPLLLSKSELPAEKERWPKVGDPIWVKVVSRANGRRTIKRANREEMESLVKPGLLWRRGMGVEGTVYHVFSDGALVLLEPAAIGLIHRTENSSQALRIGERVRAKVTYVRPDGHLNLTLKPFKESARIDDAQRILTHLEARGGAMPYSDKTDPAVLWQRFGLSKAAFKRALGKLLKEGIVYQEEGWTHLRGK